MPNDDLIIRAIDDVKAICRDIRSEMRDHIEKDEQYWRRVDQAEGSLSLIKWLGGGLSVSGLLGWLFSHFGKH